MFRSVAGMIWDQKKGKALMGCEGGSHYHEYMCYITQSSHQDGGGRPSGQRK